MQLRRRWVANSPVYPYPQRQNAGELHDDQPDDVPSVASPLAV